MPVSLQWGDVLPQASVPGDAVSMLFRFNAGAGGVTLSAKRQRCTRGERAATAVPWYRL